MNKKIAAINSKFGLKRDSLVWGRKVSNTFDFKAKNLMHLEDGFIRSIGREDEPFSIVCDVKGIYYDSHNESILEEQILNDNENDSFYKRADAIINLWKENFVSKYNYLRDYDGHISAKYILVIDQVYGDLSVRFGSANSNSFRQMLNAALVDYPNHYVVVKTHPDVFTRRKSGYFDIEELEGNSRIKIISENCHPVRLIQQSEAVYTVTSQLGFEALMWGKKVKCFGMPFYAGWGLTEDFLPNPERRKDISLEKLVYASLVKYPIYQHPESNYKTTVEEIIKYVGFQRKMRSRLPKKIYAFGFSLWKKSILKSFVQGSELIFIKRFKDIPDNITLLVWGSHDCSDLHESINIIRVEDGFLRSVGLGGDLVSPQSWVFDDIGIYYDSRKSSKLENILINEKLQLEDIDRAKHLIQKIVKGHISKYNLGFSKSKINIESKEAILVVGQVEKDASICFGTGSVNTNLKLLQVVRKKFPDAYIIYKPHPDVVVGIRKKGEDEALQKKYYDMKVDSGDAIVLFDSVHSVHTMTSLVGFEALLRNKKVYTYGQPFYAGWGLTIDAMPIERRCRKLSLEELVAGSLIRYPTYISRSSKMYTSPERVVEELIQQKEKGVQSMPLWRKFIRDLVKIWTHSNLRMNA